MFSTCLLFRTCAKCNKSVPVEAYYAYRWKTCKACVREHERKRKRIPEVKQKQKTYNKTYYSKPHVRTRMRTYQREYFCERYRTDSTFRLMHLLRSHVRRAAVDIFNRRCVRTMEILGCTQQHVRTHLESQFKEGMCWENMGEWEIDHIVPMAAFDLEDPEQCRIVNWYVNLQPLWKRENREKSSTYTERARTQLCYRFYNEYTQ